jgi:hypothetical protein
VTRNAQQHLSLKKKTFCSFSSFFTEVYRRQPTAAVARCFLLNHAEAVGSCDFYGNNNVHCILYDLFLHYVAAPFLCDVWH